MKEWQSQAHVTWDCKYHVVILPKYRKKEFLEGGDAKSVKFFGNCAVRGMSNCWKAKRCPTISTCCCGYRRETAWR